MTIKILYIYAGINPLKVRLKTEPTHFPVFVLDMYANEGCLWMLMGIFLSPGRIRHLASFQNTCSDIQATHSVPVPRLGFSLALTHTHSTPHIYPVRYLSNFGPINSVCICRSGSSMLWADRWARALGGWLRQIPCALVHSTSVPAWDSQSIKLWWALIRPQTDQLVIFQRRQMGRESCLLSHAYRVKDGFHLLPSAGLLLLSWVFARPTALERPYL